MAALSPSPIQQFFDNNGVELSGGKLFTYAAGTTTKISVFTDSGGLTAFPNPIILNSRGEPATSGGGASTGIWLVPGTAYKFVLSPATDTDPPTNAIWTIDQITASGANTGSGAQAVPDTGTINALAVALTPAPGSYTTGIQFLVKVANTNSGASTVNVNGLGAKSITLQGSPLTAGDMQSGQYYWLVYDGTYFELASVPGPGGWVTNGNLAQMAAGTVKGNNTGSPATPADIPITALTGGIQAGMEIMSSVLASWTGWQYEDGTAISRAANPLLFALWGTTFGVGDGSTTFNVPDMRGYNPRAANPAGTGPGPTTSAGTKLTDAMQGHVHYNGVVSTTGSPPAYAYATTTSDIPGSSGNTMHTDNNSAQQQGLTSSPKTDGANGTPRTATETRGASFAKYFYVKLG